MIPSGQKNGRLPDSFWHTVNRPARETGTGFLGPCPTRAEAGTCVLRAGAPKDSNFLPSEAPVKSRIRLHIAISTQADESATTEKP
jgi:hypothetical protein